LLFVALFATAGFAAEPLRPSRGVSMNNEQLTTNNDGEGEVESQKVSRAVVSQQPTTPSRGISRGAVSQQAVVSSDTPRTISRTAVSRGGASQSNENQDRRSSAAAGGVAAGAATSRSATTRASNNGLRPSVAEVGGRAIIGRTNTMTGSNVDEEFNRKQTRRARAATDNPFAPAAPAEAPSSPDDLAACGGAYFDCLNQFCNVLDQNQKQCSCSGRLTQYKKVEDSLQQANNDLNNVAQQIRYVGLSADEVRSILKETEAEMVMSTMEDRTQSRNMLAEIEKIIKSPDSANYSSGNNLNFDLDFSGGGDFDLESLFGDGGSFANMRGTELYDAAKKKCKPILARCATKKTDQQIITGQYDIEIDKACIQYEAGLQKATQNVKTNVRSATQMLQKARLAVLGDHNAYDARGCVAALDSCMRDDMVCGDNYYKCVDPTKSAIDENGKVIPGGDVIKIRDLISDYKATDLGNLLENSVACTSTSTTNTGSCIVNYLKDKIGVMENGRVKSGFCRPVLDRCRMITYNEGRYVDNNTVVKSYMERVMTQIGAAQNNIIAEYASVCVNDVSLCYNSQITQVNAYSGGISLSPSTVRPILMGACRNVALSCAYAVFSADDDRKTGSKCDGADACINSLSEMFYQSMLCPQNSTWVDGNHTNDIVTHYVHMGFVNSNCKCNNGSYAYNGKCVALPACPAKSHPLECVMPAVIPPATVSEENAKKCAGNATISTGGTTDQGRPAAYCICDAPGQLTSAGACP